MPGAQCPVPGGSSSEALAVILVPIQLSPERMFEDRYPRRCISCGFAFLVEEGTTSEGSNVLTAEHRRSGEISDNKDLACFRNRADLRQEVEESMLAEIGALVESARRGPVVIPRSEDSRSKAVREVLLRPRNDCPDWEVFVDWMSPAWHLQRREERRLRRRTWCTTIIIGALGLLLGVAQLVVTLCLSGGGSE